MLGANTRMIAPTFKMNFVQSQYYWKMQKERVPLE